VIITPNRGDGPNAEQERRIYDEMEFHRATRAYIWAVPFIAMAEWKHANLNGISAAENGTGGSRAIGRTQIK
jgi:hypothetical protein